MSSPDVRVRLTAEGVAEVVGALRKVQAESAAAAKGSTKSFKSFGSALSGVRSVLGQLAAALAVGSIVDFVRRSAEAADNLGKLSQRVGASVENISALSVGARTADVDIDELQQSLGKFAQKLVQLRSGAPEAVRAFAAIGLSARDFEGKDTAEAFELVSKRMGRLKDSADKTAIAMALFGRAGASLIPLMNDLSEGGLARLKDRARELGLLLSDDVARQIQAVNDDFSLLSAQAQGIGTQFMAAMAPDIRQAVKAISDSLTGDGVRAFQEFARVVGFVARLVTGQVLTVAEVVRNAFEQTRITFVSLAQASQKLFKGDILGANDVMQKALAQRGDEVKRSVERLKKIWADLSSNAPAPGALRGGSQDVEADAATAFQQRQEVIKAATANELKLLEAKLALEDDLVKEQYREGLLSAEEYFRKQRVIAEHSAAMQVAAALRQQAAAALIEDPTKRQIELMRVQNDLALINLKLNAERAKIDRERLKAIRDLANQEIQFQQEVAKREGRGFDAELLGLQQRLDDLRNRLAQQGVPSAEIDARVESEQKSGIADIQFRQLLETAQRRMNDLLKERESIQALVNAGKLGEIDGEKRLIAIERERLPQLQALATALAAASAKTDNEEAVRTAEEWANSVSQLADSFDRTRKAMADFKRQGSEVFAGSLEQSLAAVGREIKTIGDFWRSFVSSVLSGLQQIAAQQLSATIFKGLFSNIPGFADGGYVSGPGGYRSDGLFAFLSPGEFVVNAGAVAQPGMREWLEVANMWKPGMKPGGMGYSVSFPNSALAYAPKFADGGVVGGSPQQVSGTIQVGLEEGLVLRALETPEGQKTILKVLARNRRAAGKIIG